MNLKHFKNRRIFKKKIDNLTRKTLQFIFYPLIKYFEWYDKSKIRKKREVKKYTKEMYKEIYKNILLNKITYLTHSRLNEEHECSNILSLKDYHGFGAATRLAHLRDIKAEDLLDEIVKTLKEDDNLLIEEETVKNIFKWDYSRYEEYFYKIKKI